MDGFKQWASQHCTAFGFGEAQWPTVATWERYFDLAGFTASQLSEATGWLLLHSPPRFVGDHPAALAQRVRSQRAVTLEKPEDDDRPRCVKCNGSGMLIVPHMLGVLGGQWVGVKVAWSGSVQFYTCCIRCDCNRGRFLNCVNRQGQSLMPLEDYAPHNPSWHEQMRRRDRELAEQAALTKTEQ